MLPKQRVCFFVPRKTIYSRTQRRVSSSQNTVHRRRRTLRERELQRSSFTCIPRLPFSLLVKELVFRYGVDYRLQTMALEVIQEAAEDYMIRMFSDAVLLAEHGRRVTVMDRDVFLLLRILRPAWWR